MPAPISPMSPLSIKTKLICFHFHRTVKCQFINFQIPMAIDFTAQTNLLRILPSHLPSFRTFSTSQLLSFHFPNHITSNLPNFLSSIIRPSSIFPHPSSTIRPLSQPHNFSSSQLLIFHYLSIVTVIKSRLLRKYENNEYFHREAANTFCLCVPS